MPDDHAYKYNKKEMWTQNKMKICISRVTVKIPLKESNVIKIR